LSPQSGDGTRIWLKEDQMAKLKNKLTGKMKQVVAEITGDGKLQEEGKQQERKQEEEKPTQEPDEVNPFPDLNQLT
jgi:uncharacterized protein YjbJ (UPF0337 family)